MTDGLSTGKATQYGYRILAARPLSEKEFRLKLKRKGYGGAVVEAVTERFKELGYLNDATIAGQLARTFAVSRLWGDRRIAVGMKAKGFDRELIEAAITLVRQELTERAAIMQLLGKKGKGRLFVPEDNKEKRKLLQSLMGKGFPPGLIFEVLAISGEETVDDGE
jgi:regulatory protein